MASRGSLDLGEIGLSVAAAAAFLAISLTLGRRLVVWLIRWSNDSLSIDFPVITAVLVVTFAMALLTDLIGVQSALGAFIAGVLIGQSPILKGHIEQELHGLIFAFFSPVFFAVAGLQMDLTKLADPVVLGFAVAFVAIASLGKTSGAFIGGRLAGLSGPESLALGTGLNARGSTEVIVATIGMSLGVLSETLYTLIVAMAIITTMAMPPTLKWALSRVTIRKEERERLEKEEAAENDHLSGMERLLVRVDGSANARLALRLAGAFAVEQQLLTTVLEGASGEDAPDAAAEEGTSLFRIAADEVNERFAAAQATGDAKPDKDAPPLIPVESMVLTKAPSEGSAEDEAAKGYSITFVGLDCPFAHDGTHFNAELAEFLMTADIPLGIGLGAGANHRDLPRNILVPNDGSQIAKLATEIAAALTHAAGGRLTVLNVIEQDRESAIRRQMNLEPGQSVLHEADKLARRHSVTPKLIQIVETHPNRVIRRLTKAGSFDLVVLGAALRQDGAKFLGPRTSDLIRSIRVPIFLIAK